MEWSVNSYVPLRVKQGDQVTFTSFKTGDGKVYLKIGNKDLEQIESIELENLTFTVKDIPQGEYIGQLVEIADNYISNSNLFRVFVT